MSGRTVVRKIDGGKLFRLTLLPTGKVRLHGDFFLYPEERIEAIEEWLECCLTMPDKTSAKRYLEKEIDEEKITILGVDVQHLIDALWRAKE
ncbi:MAG: hypothetical protein QW520_07280 [Methanomassiliicoccales archaeon]